MKKGSLVRIKQSGDKKLIGTFGIVLGHFPSGHILIKRFDGRKDTYYQTRLELIA